MLLKREQLLSRLDQGQTDPVYLLFGKEEFLIREAVERIRDVFIGPGGGNFQFFRLYSDEAGMDEIAELLRTVPFGKSRRVISYTIAGKVKQSDTGPLLASIERPAKDTIFILCVEEPDMRTTFYKRLQEKGTAARFYPLFDNQFPDWVRGRAALLGGQITRDAAQVLVELVGQDLALLVNELQKIILFLHPKKRIGAEDVQEVVGNVRIFSIFELAKSLGEKNAPKSLRILRQLMDSGQSPVGIVALIANHFHRIHDVKGLIKENAPQAKMAGALGIPPMYANEYIEQAGLFNNEELKGIFQILYESDLQLKSSALSQGLVIEALIFKICMIRSY